MSENAKPPFVTFEIRAVEDREQSIAEGHFVAKDVVYAIITPAGTKDRIDKIAEDWLKDLEEAVRGERFPSQWLDAYRQRYRSWLETREIPEDGTPVVSWTMVSPAQVRMLLDMSVRTVEQLAEANEETISRLGMGGRALKDKAKAWLDSSEGQGKIAGELSSLRQENEALKVRDEQRETQLKELQAKVKALSPQKA